MLGVKFKSIFKGKRSKFQKKISKDAGIHSKLEESATRLQIQAIEVRNVSVCITEL